MNYNSLKQIVMNSISKQKFADGDNTNSNRIIAGCILYEILSTLSNLNNEYNTGISSLADSYAESARATAEGLEGLYISYKEILNLIKKFKVSSFIDLEQKEINEIIALYHDKRIKQEFDPNDYSSRMYSVNRINDKENRFLYNVHKNVISPIFKYYKDIRNISTSDFNVENVEETNPGKIIKFNINGVSPVKIMSDVKANNINILKYIYNINITPDNYVRIIIK